MKPIVTTDIPNKIPAPALKSILYVSSASIYLINTLSIITAFLSIKKTPLKKANAILINRTIKIFTVTKLIFI